MSFVQRVRQRIYAVYLLIAVIAGLGVYTVSVLPTSIFPSITFPVIRVIANSGEEPAISIIPTLTRPLEEALLRIPGIQTVRSVTSRGSVELTALFSWGTDMQVAMERAQAQTQRVRPILPSNTMIDVEWMNTATYPIMGYALTSDQLSQAELTELAEYTLKPELIRIPGVSQVQIQGGIKREFRVELEKRALEGRHLSVNDVVNAIKNDNELKATGLIPSHHELYLSIVNGQVHDIAQIEKISVPVKGGVPATLSQLGRITSADEITYTRTTANGHPAVLINLIRQPSGKTVTIADAVRKLFKDQPNLLTKDVKWSTFYDQARFVSDSVGGTLEAILIGVTLAIIILLVFLRSWRLSAIAVVNLPLTVAIVGLGLAVTGNTINLMTLAGVAAALGLIADDAIVVIENIHRHAEQGGTNHPAESGLIEIFPALIGSSLSTILILVPFSLLSGVVGAFFKPLAFTMALTLIVSFFLALFLIPVNVSLFGPKQQKKEFRLRRPSRALWEKMGGNRISRLGHGGATCFLNCYRIITLGFLRHGWLPIVVLFAFIGTAHWLYGNLPTNFLPSMDEGSIILDYWTPPGTSLGDTNRMLGEVEKIIMATPEVGTYSRRTGTQLGFFITEPNRGDYVINLKPKGQRRPIDELISELRKKIASVEPAIHTDFGQLLEDNIGDLSGGTAQPVDVKVMGDDLNLIQAQAKQIAKIVSQISGTEDVFDGIVVSGPTLRIEFDPVAGARYQMTTSNLFTELNAAILGEITGQVRVKDKNYDLRVMMSPTGLPSEEIGNIKIRTPSGALVMVSDIAKVLAGIPETEIDRENLKTYVGVTARLSGTSLGTAMSAIQNKIASEVSLTNNMRIEYGGQYQQQQSSFQELLWILFAGLVLVAVVLLFEFADWRAPLITVISAIAALAGVFLAIWITGVSLNISSYVGAIMMVGIVGENAIFVIHEGKLELLRGKVPEIAWLDASQRRLRPVAMTILATALALAPLALAIGQGSQLTQPLAIAVIGGFVLSGPVVLWIVPGLYCLLDPHGRLAGDYHKN